MDLAARRAERQILDAQLYVVAQRTKRRMLHVRLCLGPRRTKRQMLHVRLRLGPRRTKRQMLHVRPRQPAQLMLPLEELDRMRWSAGEAAGRNWTAESWHRSLLIE